MKCLALIVLLSGCSFRYWVDYSEVRRVQHSSRAGSDIELFHEGSPPSRPVRVAGELRTRHQNPTFPWGREARFDGLAMLRAKAAELRLDGVMNVYCAPPGTVNSGHCSGLGFVYEQP